MCTHQVCTTLVHDGAFVNGSVDVCVGRVVRIGGGVVSGYVLHRPILLCW